MTQAWTQSRVDRQPFYPLHAPGMPAPGPSFLRYSEKNGDKALDKKSITQAKRGERRDPYGDILTTMYRRCLYSRGEMLMPLEVKPGRIRALSVVSGHIWGDQESHGPERAKVMIIGKMLGAEEVQEGSNFAGPTGKMLAEVLLKYDIEYADFYVTNVVKTEHPEGGAGWSSKWVQDWLPLLHQEIRLVRPKYILCLGADACQALLGKTATLKWIEGRIVDYVYDVSQEYSANGESKQRTALVMGCTHPAAILRTPEMADKLDNAIARFGQMIRGVRWDQDEEGLDHRIIDNIDDLRALTKEIKRRCTRNLVSIDAEWHGGHPENDGSYMRTIQISWRHKTAACIRLRHAGGKKAFQGKFSDVARELNKILKGRRLTGQFLAADAEWLIPFGVDIPKFYEVPDSWQEFQEAWHSGRPCGFDTGLAWHAANETGDFGLTPMTLRFTAAPRYDVALDAWKHRYCLDNKIKDADLDGYGMCPEDVLEPYANYDADVTRRIAVKLGRILDADRFGNNCWEAFWRNMRAYQAVIEINTAGITVDRGRLDQLSELYVKVKAEIRARIREWSNWGGDEKTAFNLESPYQVREWLFGAKYNNKKREFQDVPVRIRPEGAKSLYLTPVMSNDKRPMLWDEVIERGLTEDKIPSTKGQALSILEQMAKKIGKKRTKSGRVKHVEVDYGEQIRWLRDYRFISQVLKLTLRPPKSDGDGGYEVDDDGDYVYEKGLPASICDDGRVRTHIYPTLETCRWASSRPNLTNLSKRREKDYKRIIGDSYRWPIRTIFKASKGCVLIEADFIGAELLGAAIMSGDEAMIGHCRRNQLPEDHPDHYDIHSQIAVSAFSLDCAPTKAGLNSIDKENLRIVAKAVIFGLMYGRGAKAIAVAAQEDKIPLTKQEAQHIIDTVFETYPRLEPFFAECRARAAEPGWLCNCFGQFRRFPRVLEERQLQEFERQAMNMPMQSMVAAAMSQALDNMMQMRKLHPQGKNLFKIVLQIHDAVLLEVPVENVPYVVDYLLPEAMGRRVPIYRTGLDGMPIGKKAYHMGVDINVYKFWGEQLMPDGCKKLGIHPKYVGFRKHAAGGWVHKEIKTKERWYKGKWHPLSA